jgi:hypothetical protein
MRPPWWGGVGTRKEAADAVRSPFGKKVFLLAAGAFLKIIWKFGAEAFFLIPPKRIVW